MSLGAHGTDSVVAVVAVAVETQFESVETYPGYVVGIADYFVSDSVVAFVLVVVLQKDRQWHQLYPVMDPSYCNKKERKLQCICM